MRRRLIVFLVATIGALANEEAHGSAQARAQAGAPRIQSGVSEDAALVRLTVRGRVLDGTGGTMEIRDASVQVGLMNPDRRAWKSLTTAADGTYSFSVLVTAGNYLVVAVAKGKKLADGVVTATKDAAKDAAAQVVDLIPEGGFRCAVENIGREQQLLPPSGPAKSSAPTATQLPLNGRAEHFFSTDRMHAAQAPPAFTEEFTQKGLFYGNFWVDTKRATPAIQLKDVSEQMFFDKLREALKRSPERKLLVFVHGYWSPFVDAMDTATRLDMALKYDGPVLLFSWPSQGGVSWRKYDKARINSDSASRDLTALLRNIQRRSDPRRIDVVVHSLGGQVLSGVVAAAAGPLFNQVLFLAPDVSRDVLSRDAARLGTVATRSSMYGSSHDCALQVSDVLSDTKRAGEVTSASGVFVEPPIQSIDVSKAVPTEDVLGHSYYLSPSVAADLQKVLMGLTPAQRTLQGSATQPQYWLLK